MVETQSDSPGEVAQLETSRSDAGTALDEGRAALASMTTTAEAGSAMYVNPVSTAVNTATLTFWSHLTLQKYLALNAEVFSASSASE